MRWNNATVQEDVSPLLEIFRCMSATGSNRMQVVCRAEMEKTQTMSEETCPLDGLFWGAKREFIERCELFAAHANLGKPLCDGWTYEAG